MTSETAGRDDSTPADLVERYRAARRDASLVVLEGLHALKHALRFGADILDARSRDPAALRELAGALAPDVADRIAELARPLEARTFDRLAPSPHPTGVMALARRPAVDLARLLRAPGPGNGSDGDGSDGDGGAGGGRGPETRAAAPIVLLERPTHHGNIGAAVRVAAAAGAAGLLTTGSHDPWHPASIRGGAGLQFALPVRALDERGVAAVVASDRAVVALDPEGEPLGGDQAGVPAGAVLVFGSERTGVSEALLARADRRVSIPMRAGVSSLNLATAVAVTLYLAR